MGRTTFGFDDVYDDDDGDGDGDYDDDNDNDDDDYDNDDNDYIMNKIVMLMPWRALHWGQRLTNATIVCHN